MEYRSFSVGTNLLHFDEVAPEHLKSMYQIHVYSIAYIYSYYYHLDEASVDEVRSIANGIFEKIKKRTNKRLKITLFEHDGVFLIAQDDHLLPEMDVYEFEPESFSYEFMDDSCSNVFDFLGKRSIDEYIIKALKSVGADKILPHIEPLLKELVEKQNAQNLYYEKHRQDGRKSPKFLVEIYNIEKNYKPKKITEFKVASMEAYIVLPEIKDWLAPDRMASKVTDIETGKVIEDDIQDIIEGIKHAKWQRKNPSLFSMSDLHRLELDSNDPDSLSWDELIANDDEFEEGDDEYEPGF